MKPNRVIQRNTQHYMSLPYNPKLCKWSRKLRKAGMLHEVLLWNRLKKRQFYGLDFDRQKIIGNYIVDFFCASASLVIEVDGSSHYHKKSYDQKRDAYLESLGLQVVHIRVKDVFQDMKGVMKFLSTLELDIEHRTLTTPAQGPTPPGEGKNTAH